MLSENDVILSPPDERDYAVCAAMEVCVEDSLPDAFEVWQPPVETQKAGNCVAQALANIRECMLHKKTGIHEDFSVGFLYGYRPYGRTGKGLIPRNACAVLCDTGDVKRKTFESDCEVPDIIEVVTEQEETLLREAEQYHTSMYIRLKTKEDIQNFIYKYEIPVLIVYEPVGASYKHAVACYGWNSKGEMLFTNSWGKNWNGDGKSELEYDRILEAWGVVDMEDITFADVEDGRWSESAIQEAVTDGIIKGYTDNTFRPEKPLTREEYAVLYQREKAYIKNMIKTMINNL